MKLAIERGATSVILHVFIQNSSVTTGAGLTGLAFDTAGLTCAKIRGNETLSNPTFQDITTLGTYEAPTLNTNIRFKQVHATNAPGWYEVHLHNDWLDVTNTRRSLAIMLWGAANMAPVNVEVELTGFSLHDTSPDVNVTQIEGADPSDTIRDAVVDDATRIDGSAVNALSAKAPSKAYLTGSANSDGDVQMDEATGNYPGAVGSVTAGVTLANGAHGGAAATITLSDPIDADLRQWLGSVPAALDANGNLPANLRAILGTLLTEGAGGRLAAALTTLLDVATPVFTAASVNQGGDAHAIVSNGTYGNSALQTLLAVLTPFASVSTVQAAPAPTTTTFTVNGPMTMDGYDLVSGSMVVFVTGAMPGIARQVISYNGTTLLVTLDRALPVAPVAGDTCRFLVAPANVIGKVLGGALGTITGTGARVVDASGNNVAPADSALSNADWTGARAGYLDELAAANLPTDVAAVKSDTTAILLDTAEIGAAGAGLTSLGGLSAVAQQDVADALDLLAAGPPADGSVNEMLVALETVMAGISSLAGWLRAMVRSDIGAGDVSVLEINDGVGTYVP